MEFKTIKLEGYPFENHSIKQLPFGVKFVINNKKFFVLLAFLDKLVLTLLQ